MNAYTSRGLLVAAGLILAGCAGAAGGSATPATTLNASSDATTGHLTFQRLAIHPDAGAPATLMNFISNGPAQGGVPCIACVNGASSSDTVGLTGPSSYVYAGQVWQYTISFTDLSFKGKCKIAFTIASGKKTIDSFTSSVNLTSAGGFVIWGIDRNRPKYSGSATVTGKYTCGKESGSQSAPIEFQ